MRLCIAPHTKERTQSVQNCMPTRSAGTIINSRTLIVLLAQTWTASWERACSRRGQCALCHSRPYAPRGNVKLCMTIVPTLRVGMQFVTLRVTRRLFFVRWIWVRLRSPFRLSATYFDGAKVSKARSSVSGPTSSGPSRLKSAFAAVAAGKGSDNLQALTYPNAPVPWRPPLCVCR